MLTAQASKLQSKRALDMVLFHKVGGDEGEYWNIYLYADEENSR
jgi:hypothetical protein